MPAKQQGRYFRPRDEGLKGTAYDSNLERRLHEGPLAAAQHHPNRIAYVWEHTYEPDFMVDRGGSITLVECKGYFQDRADCSKYLWVRAALPAGSELVFVFESPNKPLHFQAKKKDGSKMTHAEWAEKNGFRWFTEDSIAEVI